MAMSWLAGLAMALGLAGLFWPERGILPRWRRAKRTTRRAQVEDALKHLYVSEVAGTPAGIHSVAGAGHLTGDEAAAVLRELQDRRLISVEPDGIRLTEPGRELGLNVLRAHRLWESYLADRTSFPEEEWHPRADQLEHGLSPSDVDALSARLQHPTHDPHGDPIPTAEGKFAAQPGMPLPAARPDRPLLVRHVEDEPVAVYARLVVLGIHPGMPVRILETSARGIRLSAGGAEHWLDPLTAANVTVTELPEGATAESPAGEPLSVLEPGEEGRVLSISWRCRGQERRRLMDLGVLPGTLVRAEMRSPGGDPTAYRIRGAMIALRREQAEAIRIERPGRTDGGNAPGDEKIAPAAVGR